MLSVVCLLAFPGLRKNTASSGSADVARYFDRTLFTISTWVWSLLGVNCFSIGFLPGFLNLSGNRAIYIYIVIGSCGAEFARSLLWTKSLLYLS